MESLLEQQRSYLEERERLIDAMVQEGVPEKRSHKEQVNSDHRTKSLMDRYTECTVKLNELYEDKDALRKEQSTLSGGPNEFAVFYNSLKTVEDFHRHRPNEISVPMHVQFEKLNFTRENPSEETTNSVAFTDEEAYGRFLDLHECYQTYLNLKGIEEIDYIKYLTIFDQFFEIPKERKNNDYKKYLHALVEYLEKYCARVKPLLNLNEEMAVVQSDFALDFEAGTFIGWPKESASALTHAGAQLDLSAFSSWEELTLLGLDRLKSASMALKLKCGGTLEERAKRLFNSKGTEVKNSKTEPNKANKMRDMKRYKEVALLEARVYRLIEILSVQRQSTKENVQRKQARTGCEIERDNSDAEMSEEEEEEEDEDVPYNPKNLPVGWDGKPIPYWLYKLHGLNISYSCEICGNCTYKGPKAFQRHFAEWRHAHGMKSLGIPNTAHFANIVEIEEAMALWATLRTNKESERWNPGNEEFEDGVGNVVNKKTYLDLKRQGLL